MHGLDEFTKLRVFSKRMMKDGVVVDNIRERCGIQNKENRTQNRSLWDSTVDGHWPGAELVFDS